MYQIKVIDYKERRQLSIDFCKPATKCRRYDVIVSRR